MYEHDTNTRVLTYCWFVRRNDRSFYGLTLTNDFMNMNKAKQALELQDKINQFSDDQIDSVYKSVVGYAPIADGSSRKEAIDLALSYCFEPEIPENERAKMIHAISKVTIF